MSEQLFNQGREKQRERDFEGALKLYLKALESNPHNPDYLSETGVVLFNLSRKKEALGYLDKAANLEPNNPYRYSSRAYIKGSLKDFEGAIADYQKCIEIDPEDSVAYNNLGLVQEQMGYYKKAQENFKVADELEGILKENNISSSNSNKEFYLTDNKYIKKNSKLEENTLSILKGILTSRDSFNEFLSFIKNGFKLKK